MMCPGVPADHLTGAEYRSVLGAAMGVLSPRAGRHWDFRRAAGAIELHAGNRLAAPATDGEHREMLVSCGAALLNLRVAIRALGVYPAVQLFPEPLRPGLLAVVRAQGHLAVRPVDRALAEAVFREDAGAGPFRDEGVPPSVVAGLRQAARTERAWLRTLTSAHLPILLGLVDQAKGVRHRGPADRYLLGDGGGAGPLVAVVGTFHDSPLARLQAGMAMRRVLLAATVAGLSASPLPRVVAVPDTRRQLRELVTGGLWPQFVLVIGHRGRQDEASGCGASLVPQLGGQHGGLGAPLHAELGEQA